jgi:hypothetical protein
MSACWKPMLNGMGGVDVSSGLEGHMFLSAGISPYGPPPDTWTLLDLKNHGIPADAVAVDLSGILAITMGNTPGFSNLCVAFRQPGDVAVQIRNNYVFQAVANTSDGIRSTAATVITPVNGLIEWGWFSSGVPLGYPQSACLAVNLGFTRWFK